MNIDKNTLTLWLSEPIARKKSPHMPEFILTDDKIFSFFETLFEDI